MSPQHDDIPIRTAVGGAGAPHRTVHRIYPQACLVADMAVAPVLLVLSV
jgi:hypothetical protein